MCSIKLRLSTDSLVIENGTFIFSILGFNAKFTKATCLILKRVLFVVLKLRSKTPIKRIDTSGSVSQSQ